MWRQRCVSQCIYEGYGTRDLPFVCPIRAQAENCTAAARELGTQSKAPSQLDHADVASSDDCISCDTSKAGDTLIITHKYCTI